MQEDFNDQSIVADKRKLITITREELFSMMNIFSTDGVVNKQNLCISLWTDNY